MVRKTLWDEYAMAALTGLLSGNVDESALHDSSLLDSITETAGRLADDMIIIRGGYDNPAEQEEDILRSEQPDLGID